MLRTCSPLPSALRKTGLFGFPKQTVCSACWGGGVGAKGWKVPFLKVQKKKRVKCFRCLQTSVLFRFRFQLHFIWSFSVTLSLLKLSDFWLSLLLQMMFTRCLSVGRFENSVLLLSFQFKKNLSTSPPLPLWTGIVSKLSTGPFMSAQSIKS